MNLAAYDKVNNIFEDNWINFQYNRFYSRSIKYRRFFTILKRYNGSKYDYYLCFSDYQDDNTKWVNVQHYKTGIKVSIAEFANVPAFQNIEVTNNLGKVYLDEIEASIDCEIYLIK